MINLEFAELVERLRAEARERQRKAGETYGRGKLSEDLHQAIEEREPSRKVAERIAELSGTTGRNVYKAQAVIREAPDLAERVKSGEITINKAESELKKRKAADMNTNSIRVREYTSLR